MEKVEIDLKEITGEELPVHEEIKVKKALEIFKSEKWWKFVSKQESFGRDEVAVYLFVKRDDEWKRKQKMKISDKNEWIKLRTAISQLL
ncbi:MAG: hypothetical protein GWO20_19280 [Candidatus Korarchaeota archaeon]|nr:hypothetical protein [Candidatus Korarchaeota archaeon]NIU85396.1 hypothetical protein [Candidatus Thorarchaeota archaeon]NIW15494.1 hypothetical protein [Candidatus Thorarchaeota archaeon]NIW53438.1 hypothetical protein [Candidatus Korarchaeota archaeon]